MFVKIHTAQSQLSYYIKKKKKKEKITMPRCISFAALSKFPKGTASVCQL